MFNLAINLLFLLFSLGNKSLANQCPPEKNAITDLLHKINSTTNTVRIEKVTGDVRIVRADQNSTRATPKMMLTKKDEIITGDKSSVEIIVGEKNRIRLKPNSRILIQELMYRIKGPRTIRLYLTEGSAHFEIMEPWIHKKDEFQVKTITSVIGIRGTVFTVETSPKGTYVECFSGKVFVRRPNQKKPLKILNGGDHIFVKM
ncbi:MAG: FecR family protein [Bdellovibrionaceae bacterium]|nr:FecR family protein [Pseudobdellovibrionaceae bacterium]MDW8189956.1 FecR family protein [Pseudobdellovibrionaceae bacterium]